MKFLIINGPNLNLLGQREPGIYGDQSYEALCALCRDYAQRHGAQADCFQSNHEGAIIDAIHAAQGVYDAIVINPGAYTHYSYALYDALKAVTVPAYEVHISHIDQREPFRAVSVTAPACVGQLYGMGFPGYLRAMDYFLARAAGRDGLCVIGDPVDHSKSPRLQNAMLAALGEAPCYEAVQVTPEELDSFLDRVRGGEFRGFNATMPHKEALLPLMDELEEDARLYGSVNTVCLREGRAIGCNTDGGGFLQALLDAGMDPRGRRAVVLGAGGAAKAVALKLVQRGAASVTVCNRTPEKAAALCAHAPQVMRPAAFDPETLRREAGAADLLVNCTSLGMAGTAGQFAGLDFLEALPRDGAVFDLIYHPAETALLARARALGRPAANGLGMLIHQAILALERFTGQELDRAALRAVAERALEEG